MGAALKRTDLDFREREKDLPHAGGDGVAHANTISALGRGLPELEGQALFRHDGTFVVVGSGPSLPLFAQEIRAEKEKGRPICAIKGAHDWLMEQEITPTVFVTTEPRERLHQVQKKNQDTLYLLASRTDPALFDWLSDCKVILWHSYSDNEKWPELAGKFLVGGGTTSGLRAVTLAYAVFGFRRFTLYAFDSCLAEDGITKRFSGEKAGVIVDRWIDGRRFLCNAAMAQQADEFQDYYKYIFDITFDVKGDGLLAAIVAGRRAQGLRV
jgi:uncharacterized Rossmann fold enzyme